MKKRRMRKRRKRKRRRTRKMKRMKRRRKMSLSMSNGVSEEGRRKDSILMDLHILYSAASGARKLL